MSQLKEHELQIGAPLGCDGYYACDCSINYQPEQVEIYIVYYSSDDVLANLTNKI